MKKITIINLTTLLLFILVSICCKNNNNYGFDKVVEQKYQINNPDWSEDEYLEYYKKNKVLPANQSSDFVYNDDGIVTGHEQDQITENNRNKHLSLRFSNYNNWHKTSNCFDVSNVFGTNINEQSESGELFQRAKQDLGITYSALGCGPIAAYSMFEYLADSAKYKSIKKYNDFKNNLKLAKKILNTIDVVPLDRYNHKETFTLPFTFIQQCDAILESFDIMPDFLTCYGDSIYSSITLSQTINNLIDSIDSGMPVIWWTGALNGNDKYFEGHYMNIYGYEWWEGTDDNGNKYQHLLFKIRMNFGHSYTEYVDSDVFSYVKGGFVYFQEKQDRSYFNSNSFSNFACVYNPLIIEMDVFPLIGNCIAHTNRKRCGYIKRYDSTNTYVTEENLTLSAYKQNVNEAYIDFVFDNKISYIQLYAKWWSYSEKINKNNGFAFLQIKINQKWENYYDLLSCSSEVNDPTLVTIKMPSYGYPMRLYEFRIIVSSFNPSGTRNKGRIVIEDINVFFYD